MSDLNNFLHVLGVLGYPLPNVPTIAKSVGYSLDNFLLDITKTFGKEKTRKFVNDGVKKLLGQKGILKIDISDISYGPSYVKYKITPIDYAKSDYIESVNVKIQITKLVYVNEDLEIKSYKELFYDRGMDSEFEDLMYNCDVALNDYAYDNLGYHFHFS